MHKKSLILSIPVILAVLILSGWLALRDRGDRKEAEIKENPAKNTEDVQSSSTPEAAIDTSNWKTYRNENTGIEVRIPQEWDALVLGTGIDGDVICFGKKGELYSVVGGEGEVNGCAVMVMPRIKNLTLEKIRENLSFQKEDAKMFYEIKKIVVDGKDAIFVSKDVDELEKKYSVVDKMSVSVALEKDTIQTIALRAYKSGYIVKTDIVDRNIYLTLLSTLKFLD